MIWYDKILYDVIYYIIYYITSLLNVYMRLLVSVSRLTAQQAVSQGNQTGIMTPDLYGRLQ